MENEPTIVHHEDFNLLREIFSTAGEGIILSDKEGTIRFANPRAESIFKYSKDELINQKIEVLLPDHLKGTHKNHRNFYIAHPKARPMGQGLDLSGKCKDGTITPIEISLSSFTYEGYMYIIAFIIDISRRKRQEAEIEENRRQLKEYAENLEKRVKERTRELEHLNMGLQSQIQERRMAEEALKESQKLYQAIAKNFPSGIINVLDSNYNYVFVDGSLRTRLPQNTDRLIGTSYLDHFPEDLKEDVRNYLDQVNRKDRQPVEFEDNGRHYRLRGNSISKDQILVVEEDITSAKRVEKEIIKSLERERELNELKSRFVSMASHEFRTPLSTILSSASLINRYEDSEQQDKRQKHVNKIRSSVQNLTNILNNFLSIEKVERGQVESESSEIDLKELLEETADELKDVMKTGQKIDTVFNISTNEINTDPKLIKNILINLVSNASKYSSEGEHIVLRASTTDKQLLLEVQDFGIGIPPSEQRNLFQPFFRAENVTNIQGTGLGLNIVKKYVELLQGEINFTSEEHKGTTFSITIPL